MLTLRSWFQLAMMLVLAGCTVTHTRFQEVSVGGKLQLSMSKEEVRALLGDPEGIAARTMSYDNKSETREVWRYADYKEVWVGLANSSNGYDRRDVRIHEITFSNGRVIGWDLPDPYRPDLIVETRNR